MVCVGQVHADTTALASWPADRCIKPGTSPYALLIWDADPHNSLIVLLPKRFQKDFFIQFVQSL